MELVYTQINLEKFRGIGYTPISCEFCKFYDDCVDAKTMNHHLTISTKFDNKQKIIKKVFEAMASKCKEAQSQIGETNA